MDYKQMKSYRDICMIKADALEWHIRMIRNDLRVANIPNTEVWEKNISMLQADLDMLCDEVILIQKQMDQDWNIFLEGV